MIGRRQNDDVLQTTRRSDCLCWLIPGVDHVCRLCGLLTRKICLERCAGTRTRVVVRSLIPLHPGLADTLRSEYLLYDIDVHLYLPAGILSPNYEVENRTKPEITKKIEEGDTPMTPEDCVKCLINGGFTCRLEDWVAN